jgi:hypothetical protein
MTRSRPSRAALLVTLALLALPGAALAICPGLEVPLLAGTPDDFALPTEPTQQSPTYANFLTTYWVGQGARVFDQTGYDLALGQSFVGWMGAVCGATVEFRVRADGSLCDNDSVRFGYTGSTVPQDAFVYWVTLRLLSGSGTWYSGSEATFTLDLGDLPPYVDFPTNILAELQDGELEFMVEDDTSIDYAVLRVCLCTVEVEPLSWGRMKSGYR